MQKLAPFLLVMFLVACASKDVTVAEYTDMGLDEDQINIHSCIYDAIDEAFASGQVAWWESGPRNCIIDEWYRGRILLKHIEISTNYICAEFFEHSQVKPENGAWFDYQDLTFAACKPKTGGQWRLDYDSDILDYIVLQEIINKNN